MKYFKALDKADKEVDEVNYILSALDFVLPTIMVIGVISVCVVIMIIL